MDVPQVCKSVHACHSCYFYFFLRCNVVILIVTSEKKRGNCVLPQQVSDRGKVINCCCIFGVIIFAVCGIRMQYSCLFMPFLMSSADENNKMVKEECVLSLCE